METRKVTDGRSHQKGMEATVGNRGLFKVLRFSVDPFGFERTVRLAEASHCYATIDLYEANRVGIHPFESKCRGSVGLDAGWFEVECGTTANNHAET